MDGLTIIGIRERPEMKERAALWFHQKWGVPLSAYRESMDACIDTAGPIPRWYVALDGDRIVAGVGVIENDFHDRPDLSPNVCAVYVEEEYRGRGVAGTMLGHASAEMKKEGVDTLYLLTDRVGFYERYGWEFFCFATSIGEDQPSRMYVRRTP